MYIYVVLLNAHIGLPTTLAMCTISRYYQHYVEDNNLPANPMGVASMQYH